MDNKKNTVLLTVIAVATLLVAVVGATFAYFSAQGGDAKSTNVTVQTGTAGSSSFTVGSAIAITADETTFAKDLGDRTGSTTGTVSFTAPGAAGTSTPAAADLKFCYSVTINIAANNFVYTVNNTTPELILDVEKGGTKVINNLDITTRTGAIQAPTVADGTTYVHQIDAAAGATVTNSWKVTVTLKNLSTDQNANAGKSLSGTLKFEKATCA